MKLISHLSAIKAKLKLHRLKVPGSIVFLLKIYLIALPLFTAFRLLLLLTESERVADDGVNLWLIVQALFMGWRFDTVISGYILALPALLCLAGALLQRRIFYQIAGYFSGVLFIFAFVIGVADIPYFNYTFTRFNSSAFLWTDSLVFVIGMIMQNPVYIFYSLLAVVLCAAYFFVLRKIIVKFCQPKHKHNHYRKKNLIIFYPLFFLLIFVAIRGRVAEKSPIRTGTAYFCDNSFINQLGLNPVFTLIRSIADDMNPEFSEVRLMDADKALTTAAAELSANVTADKHLIRKINPLIQGKKQNVILIIMESMSAVYLKRGGAEKSFAPFMDSLAEKSIYFSSFYSGGLHTFNGVYSSLYSMPSLFRQHPLKALKAKPQVGLPQTLKANGYLNYFFMTHDDQFDNMGGYLRNNGFAEVLAKDDYPQKEIVNTLGIPDDKLYEQVIAKLGSNLQQNPFFCTILTVSNHPPYYTPPYFQSEFTDEKERGAAFADYSLKRFFRQAEMESWYKNTIFVILGDHGINRADNYELPQAFCHIPLLIYQPGEVANAREITSPGGQIDLYPTIMGLLQQPYENSGLGLDILSQKRDYIYINGDDKTGVITDSLFYIFKLQGRDICYNLITQSELKGGLVPKEISTVKQKVYSLLQTAQQLIK